MRLGTPAATTRGFQEADFEEVAKIISLVVQNPKDDAKLKEASDRVAALTSKHPLYK